MPTLAKNRRASFDYHILERFEAGIVLSGPEVKSAKAGQVNLSHAYVSVTPAGQVRLVGCHITAYPPARREQHGYDPTAERRLLLQKSEVNRLRGQLQTPGLTILPLSVYTKGSFVKVELGLARGKQQHDKRAQIRQREVQREVRSRLRRPSR